MKTIKQIADEIGVTPQAVRDKIKKEGLQSALQRKGKAFVIDIKTETAITSAFAEIETKHFAKTLQSTLQSDNHTNDKLYDILQAELAAKNKQIADLTAELAAERQHSREQSKQLAALADTAQALHAGTLQRQLIGSSTDEPLGDESPADAPEPPQKEEKRGFFGLFRR
jgi:septal ring factor EnvC (AmiA/AmiB activator)